MLTQEPQAATSFFSSFGDEPTQESQTAISFSTSFEHEHASTQTPQTALSSFISFEETQASQFTSIQKDPYEKHYQLRKLSGSGKKSNTAAEFLKS